MCLEVLFQPHIRIVHAAFSSASVNPFKLQSYGKWSPKYYLKVQIIDCGT